MVQIQELRTGRHKAGVFTGTSVSSKTVVRVFQVFSGCSIVVYDEHS